MSNNVETIMEDVFASLQSTANATSIIRSESKTPNIEAFPLVRLIQGDEEMEASALLGSTGSYECTLKFTIEITTLEGSQNIETTLNRMRRNVITSILAVSKSFRYVVFEEGSSSPELLLNDEGGDVSGTMNLFFRVEYERDFNDPT